MGFKSFADRIKMEFDPGITAIVGPNGCGKSNIADGFRWVLGEHSAKSMRGAKMSDLIFAGTKERPPLNYAEVSLTLSDVQAQLPIAYEEVCITRRMQRSGESEYFINMQPVRLKDVQNLFLDSGMGKDAYSIFEQGKIDQVINLTPLERRYIFEEAAGILRFLQRKREALKKLEQAELNMARVQDLHREVQGRIATLDEQAVKAAKYQEMRQRMEHFEKCAAAGKWEGFQRSFKESEEKTHKLERMLSAGNAHLETQQQEIAALKRQLEETEKAWRQQENELFAARSSKQIALNDQRHQEERLKELLAHEKRWESESAQHAQKRQQHALERHVTLQKKHGLELQHKDWSELSIAQRKKGSALDQELSALREQQQLKQRELMQQLHLEGQIESQSRQLAVKAENLQDHETRLKQRKRSLADSAEELSERIKELKAAVDEAFANAGSEKEKLAETEQLLAQLNQDLGGLQAQQEKLHLEITEAKARQKALQALHEQMEGFSSGSKLLLREAETPSSPFYQKIRPLYELFQARSEAPQEYEEALGAVMRMYNQTLAVAAEADFEALLLFIEKQKLKDVSLVCLETIAQSRAHAAYDEIELTPLAAELAENSCVGHFLSGIYVAENISQEALSQVQFQIDLWLKKGVLIDRKGVFYFTSLSEQNVFMRDAELKSLGKQLAGDEERKKQLDQLIREMQQRRSQLQAERGAYDKQIRRIEMQLVEIQFALQRATADFDKAAREAKLVENELAEAEANTHALKARMEQLNQEHVKAKAASSAMQQALDGAAEKLNALALSVKQQADALRRKESEMHKLSEELQKQLHALNVLEIKDQECLQQEKQLAEQIQTGRAERQLLGEKTAQVVLALQALEKQLVQAAARCQEMEQQAAVHKKALTQSEEKMGEMRRDLKKQEGDKHRFEVQSTQQAAQMQALEQELLERHKLTIQQLLAERAAYESISLEQAEKQVKSLRAQIETMGSVNLLAIEEAQQQKERFQVLHQQMADLTAAKQELAGVIAALDDESRKLFKTSFEMIKANFKKNFKLLFNGGEAELQFDNSQDLLEAGIEIIAQPPGKQMRSIQLLSGGEKCLTAMALLFAIFEVKPSPFCILDEIDAPLDDTNVERFVNIVKAFADRCQFIIITHNKGTMAIADRIFGVSMEQKGVSKLLSIDFSKSKAPVLVGV